MNQISFYTSDTRSPIEIINATLQKPVYLLNPFGKPYEESHYNGRGYFQKKNVYALIAEWNKPEWCRYKTGKPISLHEKEAIGLSLAYDDYDHVELKYPIKIVENVCNYDKADISPKKQMDDINDPIIMKTEQEHAFRRLGDMLEDIRRFNNDTEYFKGTDPAEVIHFNFRYHVELSLKADYKISRILLDNPSTPYTAIKNIIKYAEANKYTNLKKIAVLRRDLLIHEQIDTIEFVLSKLKMTDIIVKWDYRKDCISARDDSIIWKGSEFYNFLLDEAIVCEKDGTPPIMIPVSTYKRLESYRADYQLFIDKNNRLKTSHIKNQSHALSR